MRCTSPTPSPPLNTTSRYQVIFYRWMILCKLPIVCRSLILYQASRIFGKYLFRMVPKTSIFYQNHAVLAKSIAHFKDDKNKTTNAVPTQISEIMKSTKDLVSGGL